jgi:sRNA-binding protein
MKRIRTVAPIAIAVVALCSYDVRADVRADEKSKVEFAGMLGRMFNMFGGKAAREGVTSTVAVKGDRKATLNDSTGQIVDLQEEKIYDLDLKKKNYKVTTFAELRRRMEEARRKAEEDARKEQPREPEKPAQRDPNQKEVEIDFSVKNTGQKKTVNGFDTHQAIMTIAVREKGKTLEQSGGMVLTSDMWLAPKIAAMKEVLDFDVRYAQKLYGSMTGVSAEQMAAAMAMYPMMKDALGRMSAEASKLDGTPIQTITTMEAVKSAEQMAQEAKAGDDTPSTGGGISGRLGGMLAKKIGPKKDEPGKTRSTFMTMNHEVLKVVTDVAPGDVAVPAGFKENK